MTVKALIPKTHNNRSENKKRTFLVSAVWGAGIGLAVIFLSAAIGAYFSLRSNNPIELASTLALICSAAGGITCAVVSRLLYGKGVITLSMTSAAFLILGMIVLSLSRDYNAGTLIQKLLPLASVLACSTVTGYLLRDKKSQKRKLKKR